jgi:hypothetical protein
MRTSAEAMKRSESPSERPRNCVCAGIESTMKTTTNPMEQSEARPSSRWTSPSAPGFRASGSDVSWAEALPRPTRSNAPARSQSLIFVTP